MVLLEVLHLRSGAPVETGSKGSAATPHSSNASTAIAAPASMLRGGGAEDANALSPTGRMALAAATALDLRMFVEWARQHPEQGGVAYAFSAYTYCQHWREMVAEVTGRGVDIARGNDPNVAQRLGALDQMARKCGTFTKEELESDFGYALHRSGRQTDVVLVAQSKFVDAFTGGDATAGRAATSEVLALCDPHLIKVVGISLGRLKDGAAWVNYVDGMRYEQADVPLLVAAWALAACNFGEPCDAADASLQRECVVENLCYGSRRAMLAEQFAGNPAQLQRLDALAARITQIVQHGEVQAFDAPVRK